MYKATKEITFCYGHRLLNYAGKCKHLHGHNARAEVELQTEKLDERGMVVDFDDIRRVIQSWINDELDHRMLLRKDDPILETLMEHGEPCFVMETNPTAEFIAQVIYEYAADHGFPVVQVRLWENDTSFASYQKSADECKIKGHVGQ